MSLVGLIQQGLDCGLLQKLEFILFDNLEKKILISNVQRIIFVAT